ncbi:MAG: acetate kinase [Trueperaceae bacterium]|nr:MAG: acetate kinase [Trueperaceae bacterium]
MSTTVMVVNAGSSSLKIKVLPQRHSITVERLGVANGYASASFFASKVALSLSSHREALAFCLDALTEVLPRDAITAVGHRVVHGGERYREPVLLDHAVVEEIAALSALAPLHNPANVETIRATMMAMQDLPQVAVFDTAFHSTLPKRAFLYGLPRRLYEESGLRKYGFHGTSHDYVTRRAAEQLKRPRERMKLISLHLGNGSSAAAVDGGRSIDTSMGFTPLDGLLMGTRTGEIDPGVLLFLLRGGMPYEDLHTLLYKDSGLLGLSGVSSDMRDIRKASAEGDRASQEALEVFCYRIRKTIGAYAAVMGGLDAIIFTGGIGENDAEVRRDSLVGLGFLGIVLDPDRNRKHSTVVSKLESRVALLVIPTDEEQLIAESVRAVLTNKHLESQDAFSKGGTG